MSNQLTKGTVIGDTDRTVLYATKVRDAGNGFYATWVALCEKEDAFHRYAVWTVHDRPDGWSCENGDYCHAIEDAVSFYLERGGL